MDSHLKIEISKKECMVAIATDILNLKSNTIFNNINFTIISNRKYKLPKVIIK